MLVRSLKVGLLAAVLGGCGGEEAGPSVSGDEAGIEVSGINACGDTLSTGPHTEGPAAAGTASLWARPSGGVGIFAAGVNLFNGNATITASLPGFSMEWNSDTGSKPSAAGYAEGPRGWFISIDEYVATDGTGYALRHGAAATQSVQFLATGTEGQFRSELPGDARRLVVPPGHGTTGSADFETIIVASGESVMGTDGKPIASWTKTYKKQEWTPYWFAAGPAVPVQQRYLLSKVQSDDGSYITYVRDDNGRVTEIRDHFGVVYKVNWRGRTVGTPPSDDWVVVFPESIENAVGVFVAKSDFAAQLTQVSPTWIDFWVYSDSTSATATYDRQSVYYESLTGGAHVPSRVENFGVETAGTSHREALQFAWSVPDALQEPNLVAVLQGWWDYQGNAMRWLTRENYLYDNCNPLTVRSIRRVSGTTGGPNEFSTLRHTFGSGTLGYPIVKVEQMLGGGVIADLVVEKFQRAGAARWSFLVKNEKNPTGTIATTYTYDADGYLQAANDEDGDIGSVITRDATNPGLVQQTTQNFASCAARPVNVTSTNPASWHHYLPTLITDTAGFTLSIGYNHRIPTLVQRNGVTVQNTTSLTGGDTGPVTAYTSQDAFGDITEYSLTQSTSGFTEVTKLTVQASGKVYTTTNEYTLAWVPVKQEHRVGTTVVGGYEVIEWYDPATRMRPKKVTSLPATDGPVVVEYRPDNRGGTIVTQLPNQTLTSSTTVNVNGVTLGRAGNTQVMTTHNLGGN